MTLNLLPALTGYIPRDRVESILHPGSPLPEEGVALIADISGFTPLTEALTHGLSADHGAEELTRALDGVFTPLIAEIHAFRGSVIKFGGDALIVWYGREPRVRKTAVIRRALTSAWRMQQAIKIHGRVPTPIGPVTLKMKVGLTYGPVKRFNLGLPEFGFEDVLGGATLDRMAEAEHHAEPGDIMLDAATLAEVPEAMTVREWRDGFAAVGDLLRPARPKPWPPLRWSPEAEPVLIGQLIPYVPPEIYQTLVAGQAQVAELKPVVSLFIQFHGIDYDTDPGVGDKLQRYFSTAQQVVARYKGRLNRLITGDKGSLIHVIFGAPRTVEEQEARAVRCALDLQQECGGLPFITMQRIGVSVGRVFAGPVGSPNRHDYTTMGDSINLSARLMQNAADDQILLEATVRIQLGQGFEVTDLGQIRVKGKAEPISVFAVTGFTGPGDQLGLKPALPSHPLFGRETEINRMQEQLSYLAAGQGGLAVLIGEVGMGKTQLLTYLHAGVEPPLLWAGGICLAYGQTLSGYLFIDVLRHLIELPPGLTPDQATQHLAGFCFDLFGPTRLEATYPYLARFMGLPLDDASARRLEGLAGESLRWQLFEVVRDLLIRLSARRPLVLALDDLQWADPTSLQLVEAILPLTSDHPILLLLAMRPEYDSKGWGIYQQALRTPPLPLSFTLSELDRPSAVALIAHHAPALPDHLVDYLVEKSGGNPLFLVEIVRTLEAQGLLDGAVDLNTIAIEALDLPDSVQGLLLAQIDRLTVEARHTLQLASVIGKTFLSKILEAIAAGEAAVTQRLLGLAAEEYIQPTELMQSDEAYTFRHILIQESAYGTLLYERRRAYHRQVAQALEQLFPGQIDEQAGLLGFHYERAGNLEQAITYHLHAADQARLLYANEEAETLYHKVLALLDQQEAEGTSPNLDRRAKTYLKIAQVRANALDFEGAQAFYDVAFELLEEVKRTTPATVSPSNGKERVFRMAVDEPETLDPGLSEATASGDIINDLFEGLVELDTDLNIIPAVARRWTVDESGKKYTIELHKDLKWSDGAPLTAHDFVFAWQRNLDPQTQAGLAYQLYIVEGAEEFHQGKNNNPNSISIKAMDNLTLEITLKVSAAYFPYLLADPITYPQPAHIVRFRGDDWHKPEYIVCNGPFEIAAWEQDKQISLRKNPFYRGLSKGNLDEAFLLFIEPSLNHYLEDKIDWCRVEGQADLPRRYPNEVLFVQYLATYYLGFACHCPPFNNKSMRRAFATSINQQHLVKEVWSNVQRPANGGVVPPGMPGHSPEIGLQFDPTTAKAALKRIGVEELHFTLATLPGFGVLPQYLKANWQEHLGIHIDVVEDVAFDEIASGMKRGSFQLALVGWEVDYPDPDNILRVLFHGTSPTNFLGWRNRKFDRLVEQAALLSDQQARLALYHQADRILVAEDSAIVPLYYWQSYGLLRPELGLDVSKVIRGGTFKLKNVLINADQSLN